MGLQNDAQRRSCNSRTSPIGRQLAPVLQDVLDEMHLVVSTGVSMDLNTISAVADPRSREQLPVWAAGDAWLAGGTLQVSEPHADLRGLVAVTELQSPVFSIGAPPLTIAESRT